MKNMNYTNEEIAQKLKEARAQGDLSENFEYYAAKKFKNQNESRIRYLENTPIFSSRFTQNVILRLQTKYSQNATLNTTARKN